VNVANVKTSLECLVNVKTNDPELGFHILTVLSHEPDAKLPFGKMANAQTALMCASTLNSSHVYSLDGQTYI